MHQFELAETDFDHALELGLNDDERYVLLVNRGVLRVRRGLDVQAIEDLSAAIALRPDHFEAYLNRSQAYMDLKRPEDALASLAQAMERAPNQPVLSRRGAD